MLLECKFHLNRPPLGINGWSDSQNPGGKALPRKCICHNKGLLVGLQLFQKAFIHLRAQLRRAVQCQAHQRLAGLNDLTRLHVSRQHAGVSR